jgi:Family of unknown function (DUF5908)
MPIEIREIVTEVVVRGPDEPPVAAAVPVQDAQIAEVQREQIVRQAVERVLDILRREWER